ncbi:DNA ligase D [Fluviicola sp.]|uniref:DNA ligase D n=1 Tax=Fluviicola sp. TaxID=1917219 RepID=UPI0031D7129C
MGLEKYKEKRSQEKTPEPFGGNPDEDVLRFVIQKHAASHLHYDFRLEMAGVLKSWAVPKGPSVNPKDKRLAMMVEDHPYDYRTFEGIIPKGQYGGGTVIVWDEGTYTSLEPEGSKKEQEKSLLKQLYSGSLKFRLNGKKLKGEFALVKMHGKEENAWLLIKHDDKYAKAIDITTKDKSVVSKKTLEQVAKTSTNIYRQKTGKKKQEEADEPGNVKENKTVESKIGTELVKGTPKKRFYQTLEPMLATLVDKPFDKKGWIYEVKWDGYRAVAFMKGKTIELKSRNDKSFSEKFYPVYEALKSWKIDAVVDGEIVVLDENGKANFGALQNWRSEADGELAYYVFDILWFQGHDLTELPLIKRKEILEAVMPESPTILLSDHFETSGIEFLETAKKMGLEGIMAKEANSPYSEGFRSKSWLKIKANRRQEVVIGGYTHNDDSRKPFSSLLVGVFEGKKLVYTGKVGTGFNVKTQKEMLELFKPLITDKVPFKEEPDINKPSRFRPDPPHATATWLKPTLICEVSFTEMTSDGVMRHPTFEGMRDDKNPASVVLEETKATEKIVKGGKTGEERTEYIKPRAKGKRKSLLNPTDETQVRKINGHEVKFTNLSKIYWPDVKVTKRDMINYYYQAAPFILPYLKDRPQSLNRFPDGIKGFSFYQKDVTGKVPDWAETYLYHSDDEEKDIDKHFLLGNNEETLLLMAGMGCIEIHPWNSTTKKPDHPTWCIMDLDPDKNSFDQVIEAAQVTRQVLLDMGVESYCKTSGSTGLHIYIPLGAKYTYEHSKEFGRLIATLVHNELPEFTSIERIISNRKGKMYIDFLQNRPHATIAAPYSLRPKSGAPVSMPLHWDEVKKGLKITDFNIFNAMERMQSEGDIFKPVLGKGIDLLKVLEKMNEK